jgi:hypothetical protein
LIPKKGPKAGISVKMAVMYKENLISLLQTISANPALLEGTADEKKNFLQLQGNLAAQGTGNRVTDQEACFAVEVEKKGFVFLEKGAAEPANGLYYQYQVNGTQQEGDFRVCEFRDEVMLYGHVIDLKHTNSKKFYFNDGWFHDGVIYIVSWNAGTKKYPNLKTHIALGQDVPSEAEKKFMAELQAFKREKNSNTNRVDCLFPYVRFANQYSCDNFDEEKRKAHLEAVINFI